MDLYSRPATYNYFTSHTGFWEPKAIVISKIRSGSLWKVLYSLGLIKCLDKVGKKLDRSMVRMLELEPDTTNNGKFHRKDGLYFTIVKLG